MDIETSMKDKLKLKISKDNPNEVKILIPEGDKEICYERLRLLEPIHKISVNGPWSTNLKAKIKKSYMKMEISEDMAKIIIKEGFFDAMMELQDQHMRNIETARENDAHREKLSEQDQQIRIQEESQEFKQFLNEHHATIMDFLEFVSFWLLSGESKNIQTVFFAHFSTLTGLRPIWTIFLGGPGEGKTAIEQAGFSLIPRRFRFGGRATYASTMNDSIDLGPDFLNKCVISLGDLGGKNSYVKWEETLDVYKELSSEGEYDYKRMEESINPETKKREVLRIKVIGYPSVSFASTHSDGLTGQYTSRGITITPQGSDEDVLFYRRYTRPATFAKEFRDELTGPIMDLFHSYIEDLLMKLETFEVINPYYLCLQDWFEEAANNKRSSEMFPLLVDAVTLFNYESRQSITSPNGKTYYIATKEDNQTIAKLFDITPGLTSEIVAFYNKLVKIVGVYNYDEFQDLDAGKTTIKECKTIFTVATLKNQRLKRSSQDEKDQFADFCHLLLDAGKLVSLTKNRKGYNIYALEHPVKPLGSAEIDFDTNRIKEYLDDDMVSSGWGMKLPRDQIRGSMKSEIPQSNEGKFLELPPWNEDGHLSPRDFSKISQKSNDQATSELDNSK